MQQPGKPKSSHLQLWTGKGTIYLTGTSLRIRRSSRDMSFEGGSLSNLTGDALQKRNGGEWTGSSLFQIFSPSLLKLQCLRKFGVVPVPISSDAIWVKSVRVPVSPSDFSFVNWVKIRMAPWPSKPSQHVLEFFPVALELLPCGVNSLASISSKNLEQLDLHSLHFCGSPAALLTHPHLLPALGPDLLDYAQVAQV